MRDIEAPTAELAAAEYVRRGEYGDDPAPVFVLFVPDDRHLGYHIVRGALHPCDLQRRGGI